MLNEDVVIAVYGITQIALKEGNDLDATGAPLKNNKDSELTSDTKAVYKWLATHLRGVSEKQINDRKEQFNIIARKLEQEYTLNMYLMAIFMFEQEVGDNGTVPQKIRLLPKIQRIVKAMRAGIVKQQDEGLSIVKDSKIGASNIIRGFNGEHEITKAMRAYKRAQWAS